MRKAKLLENLIYFCYLVLFNTIYFVVWGFQQPVSAWISYAFVHLSLLLKIVLPYLSEKGKWNWLSLGKGLFLSSVYFWSEVFIGTIFIIWHPEGYKFSFLSQLALLIIFLVFFFASAIEDTHIAQASQRHENEMVYIKTCSKALEKMLGKSPDKTYNRKLEILYDMICTSPAKSNESVYGIEFEIINDVEYLSQIFSSGNNSMIEKTIDQILEKAEERNRILKYQN